MTLASEKETPEVELAGETPVGKIYNPLTSDDQQRLLPIRPHGFTVCESFCYQISHCIIMQRYFARLDCVTRSS